MKSRWGAWVAVPAMLGAGCTLLAGLDKNYHPLGAGGSGGASDEGVGMLGEPCSLKGALGCAGHSTPSQLICGADGKWATNGTCNAGALCDTTPGMTQGTCKPVLVGCEGKTPEDIVCVGTDRVRCGPDLLGEKLETCPYVCSGGACAVLPNCTGVKKTCGVKGDESCCASTVVKGGTYYRSYDGTPTYMDKSYPATVSDFQLDRFEITVGRFRAFVAAYPGSKPQSNDGAHPLIAGSGWGSMWDTNLPVDQNALISAVNCSTSYQTWTDPAGAHENLPMNCITWYEAFAFCAWDGGRLPTEAEWNYAAAGGSEQRQYPWGGAMPDSGHAVYDCMENGIPPPDCQLSDILKVGSKPAGDGKWGQADLAGGVWEWNLDSYAASYAYPSCSDCADLKDPSIRVARGGGWKFNASYLLSSSRGNLDPMDRFDGSVGARCARNP